MWPVRVKIVMSSLCVDCWAFELIINQGSRDEKPIQSRPTYRSASVPKGQCCYLLYRVELSSVLLVFCHTSGNVLEWGWPGTLGLAFTQKCWSLV